MSTTTKNLDEIRALLRRLSPRSRRSATDFIHYLADQEDLDLLADEQAVAEDLALFKRVREGDLSGTVTLDEACKRSDSGD